MHLAINKARSKVREVEMRSRWISGCGTLAVCFFSFAGDGLAQWWDAPAVLGNSVSEKTDGKFKFSFESRVRYEDREGVNFGKSHNQANGLVRTRLGLAFQPVAWLKFSGMLQDGRAPWYGPNAPSSVRDPVDLHEAYVELMPDTTTGFGLSAGRRMVSFGEGRLIGVPDWSNLGRTYDQARVYFRRSWARFEVLMVSPVKIQLNGFNQPDLGDRVWGTYDVFPSVYREASLDVYILRRDQNRPGGFSGGNKALGTDKLGNTTYGFRFYGPLPQGFAYSMEGAVQSGKVGAADALAGAWFSRLTKAFTIRGKKLETSAEYKFASGSKDPRDPTHTETFDQLYAANHDKFGHEDLFGWRNMHNLRSLETLNLTKAFALNFMYDNIWLASARDGLYNSAGKSVAQSINGTAGRHVGQETDLFATFRHGHWLLGAGYGYLFAGEFVKNTTPGASPSYAYLFHTYSF